MLDPHPLYDQVRAELEAEEARPRFPVDTSWAEYESIREPRDLLSVILGALVIVLLLVGLLVLL